jgi:hypothetical protein
MAGAAYGATLLMQPCGTRQSLEGRTVPAAAAAAAEASWQHKRHPVNDAPL